MTTSWSYDTAQFGIGKLASASATGAAAGTNTFQRALSYDSLGRPCQVITTIDNASYVIGAGTPAGTGAPVPGTCNANAYDANGRLAGVTYPSGFAVNYNYTSLGYTANITESGSGQTYWTANARDAEMHLTRDTAGNGMSPRAGSTRPPAGSPASWRARVTASPISPTATTRSATCSAARTATPASARASAMTH